MIGKGEIKMTIHKKTGIVILSLVAIGLIVSLYIAYGFVGSVIALMIGVLGIIGGINLID